MGRKKKGRPMINKTITKAKLLNSLRNLIQTKIQSIKEKRMRSDARRIKLIRLAKKIPMFILKECELRSRYKQGDSKKFFKSYFNCFFKFLEIISEEGQRNILKKFENQYEGPEWRENLKVK